MLLGCSRNKQKTYSADDRQTLYPLPPSLLPPPLLSVHSQGHGQERQTAKDRDQQSVRHREGRGNQGRGEGGGEREREKAREMVNKNWLNTERQSKCHGAGLSDSGNVLPSSHYFTATISTTTRTVRHFQLFSGNCYRIGSGKGCVTLLYYLCERHTISYPPRRTVVSASVRVAVGGGGGGGGGGGSG